VEPKFALKRLLDGAKISNLLNGYLALLGQPDGLSIIDVDGQQLVGHVRLDEAEVKGLWDTILEQGAFVNSARDLAAWPIALNDETQGMLVITGSLPANLESVVSLLVLTLEMIVAEAALRRAIAQETLNLYREINVLYNIGDTLGAGRELEQVCQLVLVHSMKQIKCRQGAVLLVEPGPETNATSVRLSLTAGVGLEKLTDQAIHENLSLAVDVIQSGKPQIFNDCHARDWPSTPVLCVPLRFQEEVLGVVLLTDKEESAEFAAADEKLLFALATHAANSIKSAWLLENLKTQRDEIAAMKNFVDNIFASIASGIITTDMENVITSYNRAAEAILSLPSQGVLDRPYQQVLGFLNNTPLPSLITDVQEKGHTFVDFEINPDLPSRGRVNLTMSLSQLRGSSEEPLGVTIVMDDVTEKKRFERERRIIRHYLPPELVDALPEDLDELKLRGDRQMITTLFADIRGFTSFSEIHSPETVVEVINCYFALAAKAVRKHRGIIDKYLGDAVMVLYNTPLLTIEDHAWSAVQTAWDLKLAIDQYHDQVEPEFKMNFGIGICTGEAVVGNVGAIDRVEYTAIGDAVNVAKRLQENAAVGQILMSRSTWQLVRNQVRANPLPSIRLKGRRNAVEVFELVELLPTAQMRD
jgi:adenylate cyclase